MTAPVTRRLSNHCTRSARPLASALNSRVSTCAAHASEQARTVAVICILWTSSPAAAACRTSMSSGFGAILMIQLLLNCCRQETGGGRRARGVCDGLHAAAGRRQRLDFLHVLGPPVGGRKHSGARTPRQRDSLGTGSRATKRKRPVLPPLVPCAQKYDNSANGTTPRIRSGGRQSSLSFMLRGELPRPLMNVRTCQPAARSRLSFRSRATSSGVWLTSCDMRSLMP